MDKSRGTRSSANETIEREIVSSKERIVVDVTVNSYLSSVSSVALHFVDKKRPSPSKDHHEGDLATIVEQRMLLKTLLLLAVFTQVQADLRSTFVRPRSLTSTGIDLPH